MNWLMVVLLFDGQDKLETTIEHKFDNYLEMMNYRTFLMEDDLDYPPENYKIFCMKV
jgi:hypothetical protein